MTAALIPWMTGTTLPSFADTATDPTGCSAPQPGSAWPISKHRYDPASAAAASTVPRELFSAVLLGPEWPPVLLAKKAAGIDAISGGRLTLPAVGDEVVGRIPTPRPSMASADFVRTVSAVLNRTGARCLTCCRER